MASASLGRARRIARFLSSAGGMIHVDADYHDGTATAEDRATLFTLRGPEPFDQMRVVPRHKLYTQRLWLLGGKRIAIEGLPRGAVDDALVMMSVRTFASLADIITDARPDGLVEWQQRHEGE